MSTLLVENIRHEDASDIAIVLSSNGTLGIGTVGTARNDPLTVKGLNNIAKFESSAAAVELRINAPTVDKVGLTTGTNDNFFINVGSGDRLYIKNNGYVGIGSDSPDAPLYIDGSVYSSPYGGLRVVGAGSGAGTSNVDLIADFGIGTSGSVSGVWLGGRSDETTGVIGAKTASGNLAFEVYQNGWQERMRINNDGKIGISQSNPQYQLDITRSSGNTDVARIKGNTGNAFIRFQDNDNSSDFTLGSDDGGPTGSGSFVIYDRNASSYRWRLDSAGRVTMPYQPCAFAFKSSFGNSTSDSGAGALNTVGTNVGGHFNTSTGRFTAPVAGSYHVCWTMMNSQSNTGTAVCTLRINDVGYKYFHVENSHPQGQSDQAIVTLSANDWLDISLTNYHWNGGSTYKYPSMSVFLIG